MMDICSKCPIDISNMEYREIAKKVRIEYNQDGIFKYILHNRADVDLLTAKQMVAYGDELGSDAKFCVNLVDTRKMLFINSEARKYLAAQQRSNLVAIAIVINSVLQKSLANLYFKFTVQATPTKLFTEIAEAEVWLKEQLAEKSVLTF